MIHDKSVEIEDKEILSFIGDLLSGKRLSTLLHIEDKDIDDLMDKGKQLIEAHEYQEALTLGFVIAFIDPDNINAWILAGRAAYLLERYDLAAESLSFVIAESVESPAIYFVYGMSLYHLSMQEEAKESLEAGKNFLESKSDLTNEDRQLLMAIKQSLNDMR